MKERPILFSAPMVRAILAGTKSQTRRIVKPQPVLSRDWSGGGYWTRRAATITQPIAEEWSLRAMLEACPYGQPGDRLWVRETWRRYGDGIAYRADYGDASFADEVHAPWKPSIHMPRWASRITLEVTGVRVERLKSISRGDAMAEGCPFPNMAAGADPRQWYAELWDQINGAGSWDANPWCWVLEFRRLP